MLFVLDFSDKDASPVLILSRSYIYSLVLRLWSHLFEGDRCSCCRGNFSRVIFTSTYIGMSSFHSFFLFKRNRDCPLLYTRFQDCHSFRYSPGFFPLWGDYETFLTWGKRKKRVNCPGTPDTSEACFELFMKWNNA